MLQALATVFDCWNGNEWVRDEEKIAVIARNYRHTFNTMMMSVASINDNPLIEYKLTELIATGAA